MINEKNFIHFVLTVCAAESEENICFIFYVLQNIYHNVNPVFQITAVLINDPWSSVICINFSSEVFHYILNGNNVKLSEPGKNSSKLLLILGFPTFIVIAHFSTEEVKISLPDETEKHLAGCQCKE